MTSFLDLSKDNVFQFNENSEKLLEKCQNLFVITHLGQLKQMEALINQKNITNNTLAVLYTSTNFVVPQTVHDKFSDSLFEKVLFIDIPVGINKTNLKKLNIVKNLYEKLLCILRPNKVYLNSFEGHYSIFLAIAKSKDAQIILVEEGTSTYKFNVEGYSSESIEERIDFKKKFIATVGQTQVFKNILGIKLVRELVKYNRYGKDVVEKSKLFVNEVINEPTIQNKLIRKFAGNDVQAVFESFTDFDKAYGSFPKLIQEGFNVKDVEYFSLYSQITEDDEILAQEVVDKYNITSNDVLYVSQRYFLDPHQYVGIVSSILTGMTDDSQKIFIKLHPKESDKVFKAFRVLEENSNSFVIIDDNMFLIEPVIKVSKISRVVGLTSTVLVYTPLISEKTKATSIAESLINYMPKSNGNNKGIAVLKQHLEIIKIFENIEFI